MRTFSAAFSSLVAGVTAFAYSNAFAADMGVATEPMDAPQPEVQRSILLGAGAGFEPLYEGSKEYRAFPFPIVSYDSGMPGPRRFEFRSLDDIRFHALRKGGFSIGPIAGYRFGRDEADSARLSGLGDIDGGLVLGGFASYDFVTDQGVTWGADVGLSTQVSGDAFDAGRFAGVALPVNVRNRLGVGYGYGYEVDFGLSNEIAVNDRLNIATRIGATYASDDYMRTYFGVGAAQAVSSAAMGNSVPAFTASSGLKNAYVNVDQTYQLTDRIQLQSGLGYSRLLNDAARSPATESVHQFSGTIGAAYRFKF